MTTPGTLDEASVHELRSRVRGQIIRPGDADYERARRVYNAMHDRRPALIVRATGVADVMATVRFADRHGLALAVRGGGHSVAGFGTCDDGLVLDLGTMRGIRVDSGRRTVRAEGGCTWGDVNHATYAFGLATTGGIVSTTGIAGLTLGGGLGYLARSCGLSCDNLLSADVVTADGGFVTCSEDRDTDLFWAIRGGGGNFGVVTSFEFRLHAVTDIFGGPTFPATTGIASGPTTGRPTTAWSRSSGGTTRRTSSGSTRTSGHERSGDPRGSYMCEYMTRPGTSRRAVRIEPVSLSVT